MGEHRELAWVGMYDTVSYMILYDTVLVATHHYTLVKTYRIYNIEMNPNANCVF